MRRSAEDWVRPIGMSGGRAYRRSRRDCSVIVPVVKRGFHDSTYYFSNRRPCRLIYERGPAVTAQEPLLIPGATST